jgi:Dolichyl-phosphate-mannose-protein mannosyltransferase
MQIAEKIQSAIHTLEVGFGSRVISVLAIVLTVIGLGVLYDTRAFHNLDSPEPMDAAQVARNLAEGRGFVTENIRPFSVYLVQKHSRELHPTEIFSTNAPDLAQVNSPHPDLANAPVYPVALAGLIKLWPPNWAVDLKHPFWSEGGSFRRYQPDFHIAIFNQLLLLLAVVLTYLVAQKVFDAPTAWLAALLMLGLDTLWKFSVSGQSTLLLLVIFLSLAWCLVKLEANGRSENPNANINFLLAVVAGLLTALGMLTRYSFGWLIVPVIIFVGQFGGARRKGLAVMAMLAFTLAVTPWIARNFSISGTPFGTAGFAVAENTAQFPGDKLMRSLNPDLADYYYFWAHYTGKKLMDGIATISKTGLLQLGGGWLGMLFFTGLLVILPPAGARRLRYFTLLCLGVFLIVEPLGRTQLSVIIPEINSENLLVLLTPLIAIFGTGFFLTLLNQMELTAIVARGIFVIALAVLCWQPLANILITSRVPGTYPPYYPPDIQKISSWMQRDELLMSDIPWAVAWYGDRQCTWMTINSGYEFFEFNDHIKTVQGLYLSLDTIDGKIFSECLQGAADNWKRFAWQLLTMRQNGLFDNLGKITLESTTAADYSTRFPLKFSPSETLISGLYLTDRQRW